MTRHFLDLADAGPDALRAMLADARSRKLTRAGWPKGKPDPNVKPARSKGWAAWGPKNDSSFP